MEVKEAIQEEHLQAYTQKHIELLEEPEAIKRLEKENEDLRKMNGSLIEELERMKETVRLLKMELN